MTFYELSLENLPNRPSTPDYPKTADAIPFCLYLRKPRLAFMLVDNSPRT